VNSAAGLVLIVISAAPASAQKLIGEARVLGTVAWAPGADAPTTAGGYPLPEGRAMVGAGAGLSFASGRISAGPETLVVRGSDRKMFALGGVARLHFAGGMLRPYLLVGAGVYTWNHKATLPPEFTSPGQPSGPFWLADVTQWAANAGGGLMAGRDRLSLVAEIRGHKGLTRDELSGSRSALAFSVGGLVSW